MALFFRIVQSADGRWTCRQGRQAYDTHGDRPGALAHIRALAAAAGEPVEIFCHSRDGTIQQLPTTESEPVAHDPPAAPPGGQRTT
jgi:hypothetical protein